MYERNSNSGLGAPPPSASAKYLSSGEVETVIRLLSELREQTLSRSSYSEATRLIVELGGRHRLPGSSVADPEGR